MTGSVVLPSDLSRSPSTKLPEAKGSSGMVDHRGPATGLATASCASATGDPPTSSGRTLGEPQASRRREILAKYPQIKQLSSWIRGPFSRGLSIQGKGKGEAHSLLCAAWTAVSLCRLSILQTWEAREGSSTIF